MDGMSPLGGNRMSGYIVNTITQLSLDGVVMALQDDDLILVGRSEPDGSTTNYKITWAQLKAEIQSLPFDAPEDTNSPN